MSRPRAYTVAAQALQAATTVTALTRQSMSHTLSDALRSATSATAPARRLIGDIATRLANDPVHAFDLLYAIATSEANRVYSAKGLAHTTVRQADELLESALTRLLLVQAVAAGTAGAAFSIGSVLTLPIAALFSMYVKTVSVAAVAHVAGHDLHDAATKAKIYAIVIGETQAAAKYRTIVIDGTKIAVEQLAKTLCRRALTIARIGRAAPFIGAGLSGTLEMVSIRTVTRNAITEFLGPQSPNSSDRTNDTEPHLRTRSSD